MTSAAELPVGSVVIWDESPGWAPKVWVKTHFKERPWRGYSWFANDDDMDRLLAKGAEVFRVGGTSGYAMLTQDQLLAEIQRLEGEVARLIGDAPNPPEAEA